METPTYISGYPTVQNVPFILKYHIYLQLTTKNEKESSFWF